MASEIKVDTISEKTSANGVTIDGVLVKDSVAHSGLVKLQSSTVSGGSEFLFDNVFTSDYRDYKIFFSDIQPASDQTFNMIFRIGGASGSNLTGTYGRGFWLYKPFASSGSSSYGVGSDDKFTDLMRISGNSIGSTTNETGQGEMTIYNPLSTTSHKMFVGNLIYHRGGNSDIESCMFNGAIQSTTAVTGVKFLANSGNISGTIDIYGVKV